MINFERYCCENWVVYLYPDYFSLPQYTHWYMFIKTSAYMLAGQSKQKGFFLSGKKLNELTSCVAEVDSQTGFSILTIWKETKKYCFNTTGSIVKNLLKVQK